MSVIVVVIDYVNVHVYVVVNVHKVSTSPTHALNYSAPACA